MRNLRSLVEKSEEVFASLSKNQRQRLVYVLLNAARAEDRAKFMWYLERALAARIGETGVKQYVEEVRDVVYPEEGKSTVPFSDLAHAIILGIIGSEKKEGGERNE